MFAMSGETVHLVVAIVSGTMSCSEEVVGDGQSKDRGILTVDGLSSAEC